MHLDRDFQRQIGLVIKPLPLQPKDWFKSSNPKMEKAWWINSPIFSQL
jgi:hypothetical protein